MDTNEVRAMIIAQLLTVLAIVPGQTWWALQIVGLPNHEGQCSVCMKDVVDDANEVAPVGCCIKWFSRSTIINITNIQHTVVQISSMMLVFLPLLAASPSGQVPSAIPPTMQCAIALATAPPNQILSEIQTVTGHPTPCNLNTSTTGSACRWRPIPPQCIYTSRPRWYRSMV
jgi:hypothetical protein